MRSHRDAIVLRFLTASIVAFLTVADAGAIERHVPADFPTIQAAITASVNGDSVIIADGVYTGPGNVNLDFAGRLIEVRSESDDPAQCIIDCENVPLTRGFLFHSGETSEALVQGLTVRHGTYVNYSLSISGAGIYLTGSSPTIRNCVLVDNDANGFCSGLHADYASNIIVECCTFSGNGAYGLYASHSSTAVVTQCTVTKNGAGGMDAHQSHVIVVDCDFVENGDSGLTCGYNAGASANVRNCSFVGNDAFISGGGGIHAYGSSPILVVNCVFRNNQTSDSTTGGGILVGANNPQVTIVNCTFENNWVDAAAGGAVANYLGGPIVMTNCICWNNHPDDLAGPILATHCNTQEGYPGEGNISVDPLFYDAANGDLRTRFGPCTDAGNNAAVPVGVMTDLLGNPRLVDRRHLGVATVDMGAYELVPCPADIAPHAARIGYGNGVVNVDDLLDVINGWGRCPGRAACSADITDDGVIGEADLIEIIDQWGACP